MTELEQQLTNALTALSKQYEAEMEQQAEWVGELQEQVQRLEESVKDLKPQLGRTEALAEDLKQQVKLLRSGLQGDRRSIARGVNVIWKQAATGAGTVARAGAGLWPEPLISLSSVICGRGWCARKMSSELEESLQWRRWHGATLLLLWRV